jgi:hypothetical protein
MLRGTHNVKVIDAFTVLGDLTRRSLVVIYRRFGTLYLFKNVDNQLQMPRSATYRRESTLNREQWENYGMKIWN